MTEKTISAPRGPAKRHIRLTDETYLKVRNAAANERRRITDQLELFVAAGMEALGYEDDEESTS